MTGFEKMLLDFFCDTFRSKNDYNFFFCCSVKKNPLIHNLVGIIGNEGFSFERKCSAASVGK